MADLKQDLGKLSALVYSGVGLFGSTRYPLLSSSLLQMIYDWTLGHFHETQNGEVAPRPGEHGRGWSLNREQLIL